MDTQAIVTDIIRHGLVGTFDIIKVTGSEDNLYIETCDASKTLYLKALVDVKDNTQLLGEFGITNTKMLNGLLNHSAFATPDTKFEVTTREVAGAKFPDKFSFRSKKAKAEFNLMNIVHVPAQQKIAEIPWEIRFKMTKEIMTDFQSFAGLYSEVDKIVTVRQEGADIYFSFGKENSSVSQSGSILLADNVEGKLSADLSIPVDRFSMLMKLAIPTDHEVMFTGRGLMGVSINSQYGRYNYYLRQSV